MTAPTEDLITDLEALLAGEPVFVVAHPVSRAISALHGLRAEVERLRDEGLRLAEFIIQMNAPDQGESLTDDERLMFSVASAARSALTGSAQG